MNTKELTNKAINHLHNAGTDLSIRSTFEYENERYLISKLSFARYRIYGKNADIVITAFTREDYATGLYEIINKAIFSNDISKFNLKNIDHYRFFIFNCLSDLAPNMLIKDAELIINKVISMLEHEKERNVENE